MKRLIYIIPFLFTMIACQTTQDQGDGNTTDTLTPQEKRDLLIERNISRIQQEKEQIAAFVDTSEIQWSQTGTGLHYHIFDGVEGTDKIVENDIVTLNYRLTLLDGYEVESSVEKGLYTIRANKDNGAVVGMHEALLNLHVGDSAVVLIPSHLAWGIAGDQRGVPPMSSVLYYFRIQE